MCCVFQDTGEPGWWRGELNGREGVFPDNFVALISESEKEVKCIKYSLDPADLSNYRTIYFQTSLSHKGTG